MTVKLENSSYQLHDYYPKFKAAAVQASSVWLDREATTEKAIRLIEEAADNGADIIAFPEVYIPGDCYWAQNITYELHKPFNDELFMNSVEIPSATTDKLCEVAKRRHIFVVMGINERDKKSIYNTLIYIDRDGKIVGKHRKFIPSGPEKLVWGEGDGSTHKVIPTEFGRLGSLICGEHAAVLPGYVLGSQAEQIHIASWVAPVRVSPEYASVLSRAHACQYDTFVIMSMGMIDQQIVDKLGGSPDLLCAKNMMNSWTCIIDPNGNIIAGPLPHDQEGIVYADIDLAKCIPCYFHQDPNGNYMGKQFQLFFDDREVNSFNLMSEKTPPEIKKEEDMIESYCPDLEKDV